MCPRHNGRAGISAVLAAAQRRSDRCYGQDAAGIKRGPVSQCLRRATLLTKIVVSLARRGPLATDVSQHCLRIS